MPGSTWIGCDGDVDPLGRLTEVHRQHAGERYERLLLRGVAVPAALGAGLVAPEVRPRVGETGPVGQLGDMARRLTGLVGTRDPRERVGADYAEAHGRSFQYPGRSGFGRSKRAYASCGFGVSASALAPYRSASSERG